MSATNPGLISPAYFFFMAFLSLGVGQCIVSLFVPPRYTRFSKRRGGGR